MGGGVGGLYPFLYISIPRKMDGWDVSKKKKSGAIPRVGEGGKEGGEGGWDLGVGGLIWGVAWGGWVRGREGGLGLGVGERGSVLR